MNRIILTTISIILANSVFFLDTVSAEEMVKIPAGEFLMGSENIAKKSQPKHKVYINEFYMDKYETTQAEYDTLMEENPSETRKGNIKTESPDQDSISIGPNYPVTRVMWTEAAKYCNVRSRSEGLEPCYDESTWACDFTKNGYRLPTEAEWEYACRADTTTTYYFGDDANELSEYANYWPDAEKYHEVMADIGIWEKPLPRLIPVGKKKPNSWDLYDMLGNVSEWCNDWYDENYYSQSPESNPRGPEKGEYKVVRGGCYRDGRTLCAYRSMRNFKIPSSSIGFRCVRNCSPDEKETEQPK